MSQPVVFATLSGRPPIFANTPIFLVNGGVMVQDPIIAADEYVLFLHLSLNDYENFSGALQRDLILVVQFFGIFVTHT